ncbi:CdaR family transcriptional regulator [Streptomyces mirabilis]|uniref:CdaR family transcriptional regulator n=1 Tax=Streptomyces mirabilis TaxID=68239 RepID=UPI0038209321
MLTPSLAQEIACDTTAVIGRNVLITDKDGIVIGSGNPSRVGSFHEASVAVARDQEAATHNAAQASHLQGVRPGITLPLILDGEGVGTVGITGPPQQVRGFGLVVKRQIEILLRESVSLRSHILRERALEDLFAEIVSYNPDLVGPDHVHLRATELGYDLTLQRIVIVVEASADPHRPRNRGPALDLPALGPGILRTLRECFPDPQDLVASLPVGGRFAVLHRITPRSSTPEAEAHACATADRLVDALRLHLGLAAHVALAQPASTVAELHIAYQDACDALRLGMRISPGEHIHLASKLRIHQALSTISHRARTQLVNTALRRHSDWPLLRETLIAWGDNAFNQMRAAEALHIHRNTLVYRLNKIEQISGCPLRSARESITLYLAAVADQLDTPGQG